MFPKASLRHLKNPHSTLLAPSSCQSSSLCCCCCKLYHQSYTNGASSGAHHRRFHTSHPLSLKKHKKIRPYAPNHPTRDSMSDALFNIRKISAQHDVYHPDEIDFRGFIKSLPLPNYQNDLSAYIEQIELMQLIPKLEDMGLGEEDFGKDLLKKKRKVLKKKKRAKKMPAGDTLLLPAEEHEEGMQHSLGNHFTSDVAQSEMHSEDSTALTTTESTSLTPIFQSKYAEKFLKWIETNKIPCNDVNILFRAFVHPNWLVYCFPEDVNIRNLINRISNQKLAQKGSDILNFVLESYMSSHTEHNSQFLQHYEENRTKMTLLMYNDPMRFQDYMNRDLKETHKRLMTNEALAYAAKKLNLKSHVLAHFDIVEDHDVPEDDLLPRTDPEYMIFPTSKRAVVDNHDSILNANLLEALVGAIHLDSGMETATRFIVDHVRPLLYEYVQVVDQMDYPRELARLLKQFRSQVEYRALKDPVNRGEVKVGVFIGTRHIDFAFGETFAVAKYRAAQKVYLDLRHNPVKIKQLEDSLVNQGYVQSMHFLKMQRIRDCMEFVPGAYQQQTKKQFKLNKGDVNFYIQNKSV